MVEDNIQKILYLSLSFLSIILAFLLLLTNILFKKKIVKSEFLLFQRYIILIAFNIYYFVSKYQSINNISSNEKFKDILFIFITIYYSNIISVNFELYKEISCPFYNFISIFNNKWKNIFWEIFTLFFIIFGFILGKYIKDEGSAKDNFEINLQLILRINQIPLISILTLLNIISFIITIMNMTVLNNFQNKSKRQYTMKIILNFIFSIIQLGYTSIIFVGKFLPIKDIFNIICCYYFLGFFIIDLLINMIIIRNSEFYYYILGRTKMSYFYCLFGCSDIYKPVIQIKDNDIDNEGNNNSLLSSNEEIIKKDNILYYFYNDLKFRCISQFNLEVSEYFLNISIACLSSIFDKMKSTKKTNNENANIININNNKEQKEISPQLYEFEFNESSFTDNEKSFITKLKINTFDKNTNYKDKFTVDIKYFYYNTFCSIIKNKNINLSDLIKSLLSHNCNFPFLICKNSKNEYFKSMKTLNLKTNDRKYTIEIFSNVLNDDSKNSILEEYLAYITSKSNTFLPILIGAFKISINNLHPFTIFISRNSIMENVPKELFNYWQLMRYLPKKEIFEKIATSKDGTSLCITEDNLFTTNQKIIIKDYLNFHSILSEDVAFISNIGSKNFSLLIMYYEFDKNNPNIEEYLNMSRFNSKSIRNESEINNKKLEEENIEFINSEIKKEETVSKSNLEFTIMNANKNGNGFESTFNDNKCMVFFSFEKIFEFRGYSFINFDYNDFIRKIIDYFDSNYDE